MMIEIPSWAPARDQYHVRLTAPTEKTTGGVWLPEEREHACTEGEVLAVGPGTKAEFGRSNMAAMVGERVLFEAHRFRPLVEGREGMVSDAEIVAIEVGEPPYVEPCGEWLLVETAPFADESAQGVAIPEKARRRDRCGMVLDYGYGPLRRKGAYSGTRTPIRVIMGLADGVNLIGLRVYWEKTARLLILKGPQPNLLLVRASELIAVEEESDAESCYQDVPGDPERA